MLEQHNEWSRYMAAQKAAVCEFPAPKGIQGRCIEQLPSVLSLCEVLKGLHCTSARRLTQGASRLVPMEQGTDALQWQQVESAYEACDRLWVDALQRGLGALKGGAANVPASGTVAASQENGIYQRRKDSLSGWLRSSVAGACGAHIGARAAIRDLVCKIGSK
jgi:hypothetical protein